MKKFLAVLISFVLVLFTVSAVFAQDSIKGDVNNDGEVTSDDALEILMYVAGDVESLTSFVNADVNSDGKVNTYDAVLALQISVSEEPGDEGDKEDDKQDDPTTPTDPPVAETKEELIEKYNNGVNDIISSKRGYVKKRTNAILNMKSSSSTLLALAKDAVNEFLGVGENTYTNKKGTANYLSNASLVSDDVKSAICQKNGDSYTITMTLKDGISSATSKANSDSSPLQRSGLFNGAGNNKDYDYKNALNYFECINEAVSIQSVKQSILNAKIVAEFSSETDELLSFTVTFKWEAELKGIKYGFISADCSGDGNTSVTVTVTD